MMVWAFSWFRRCEWMAGSRIPLGKRFLLGLESQAGDDEIYSKSCLPAERKKDGQPMKGDEWMIAENKISEQIFPIPSHPSITVFLVLGGQPEAQRWGTGLFREPRTIGPPPLPTFSISVCGRKEAESENDPGSP